MKRLSLLMLVAASAATLLCGNSCKKGQQPEVRELEEISLDKVELTLEKGEGAKLNVTLTPEDLEGVTLEWKSIDGKVAEVDEFGYVVATGPGTTRIIVTAKEYGLSAQCTVTVTFIPVTSVSMPALVELEIGQTIPSGIVIKPENATDKTVEWITNSRIFSSNEDNTFTGLEAGEATVTAKVGDKTAEFKIKVSPAAVKSITLNKTELSLNVGETFKLIPTINPAEAQGHEITWESDNKTVASVDGTGEVKGKQTGQAKITVKCDGKTATCAVTIK